MSLVYVVNVDRPTKRAMLHLVISPDRECQPRKMRSADGFWRVVYDECEAKTIADDYNVELTRCKDLHAVMDAQRTWDRYRWTAWAFGVAFSLQAIFGLVLIIDRAGPFGFVDSPAGDWLVVWSSAAPFMVTSAATSFVVVVTVAILKVIKGGITRRFARVEFEAGRIRNREQARQEARQAEQTKSDDGPGH